MAVTEIVKCSPLLCPPGDGLYDVGDVPADDDGALMTPGEAATMADVARKLRVKILTGQYAAGDRFPSRTEIAAEYGISPETGSVATRMLRGEGLVTLEQGRGTFVCELFPFPVTVAVSRPAAPPRTAATERRAARAAEHAYPAVRGMTFARDAGAPGAEWVWTMTVQAADAGRAAAIGYEAARVAAGPGAWRSDSALVETGLPPSAIGRASG